MSDRKPLRMPVISELDGIRAIAVTIVFFSHLGFGTIVPGGLGVTIFFFLSGYLITSLLRAEASATGRIDLPAFYIRRTLRIMPPLYVTLAICGLLAVSGLLKVRLDGGTVISQIFFYSNYERLWGAEDGYPIPLWSLAVEEHFYLIFPFLFATYLVRASGRKAALACLVVCALTLVFRLIQAHFPGGLQMNYFLTHTRIDSILFGCILAVWNNPILDGKAAWKPSSLAFFGGCAAVVAAALVRNPYFGDTFRYTIQGAGLFVIFSYILHGATLTSAILNASPFQLIGRLSYTIYLIHVVARNVFAKTFHTGGLTLFMVTAVGTMVYAGAMFLLVERPLAKVRKRLHEKKAPAPMEAPLHQN